VNQSLCSSRPARSAVFSEPESRKYIRSGCKNKSLPSPFKKAEKPLFVKEGLGAIFKKLVPVVIAPGMRRVKIRLWQVKQSRCHSGLDQESSVLVIANAVKQSL
jgi:hypothetical protein